MGLQWQGVSQFRAKLTAARRRLTLESRADLEVWGRRVEYKAKTYAPVDLGKLRQSISYEPGRNGNSATVTASAPYAAFVEFGTGAGVLIPPGWEELAARFKGKGNRKITLSPQPYLYPALREETPTLYERLRSRLRNFL